MSDCLVLGVDEVVVGDLVEQLAVLLLRVTAHLGSTLSCIRLREYTLYLHYTLFSSTFLLLLFDKTLEYFHLALCLSECLSVSLYLSVLLCLCLCLPVCLSLSLSHVHIHTNSLFLLPNASRRTAWVCLCVPV